MNEEQPSPDQWVVEQKPSIKLTKNSKGYNWEIKIIGNDIEELKDLNDKMVEEYGGRDE